MAEPVFKTQQDVAIGLMHVLAGNLVQLDITYPIWLEASRGIDISIVQGLFRDFLVNLQPELEAIINTVLPLYFEVKAIAAELVVSDFTPELADRMQTVNDKLIEYNNQVAEVEAFLSTL